MTKKREKLPSMQKVYMVLEYIGTSIYFQYLIVHIQARSQVEARKPGLQHFMGLNARNPGFVAYEQQRCRPACASTQSDQRLCYSLSEK